MITIRPAVVSDATIIVEFIKALADYEKLTDAVEVTPARITESLFCNNPKAFALIADVDSMDSIDNKKQAVGFALYFYNYSTFLGKHGIYLEDFYVKEEFRSKKIGFELFKALGNIAANNQCGRIDWAVLDWNKLAIDFYNRLEAEPQNEWIGFRLEGEALKRLSQL